MDPVRLFAVVVLVALPTVMLGGYFLLSLLGRNKLSEFQMTYFRAGHAHGGVLLIFALAYLVFLTRTDFGTTVRWLACFALLVGVLAQSGGLFLHMGVGKPGRWSVGNSLTTAGALVLALTTLLLAYGVAVTPKAVGF